VQCTRIFRLHAERRPRQNDTAPVNLLPGDQNDGDSEWSDVESPDECAVADLEYFSIDLATLRRADFEIGLRVTSDLADTAGVLHHVGIDAIVLLRSVAEAGEVELAILGRHPQFGLATGARDAMHAILVEAAIVFGRLARSALTVFGFLEHQH